VKAPLLSVRDLRVSLRGPRGPVTVVDGVSFDLGAGEITGLAGESGCGKSVTALALMGLLPAGLAEVRAERMQFASQDLLPLGEPGWRKLRGRRMAMVFQDPLTALDPVFTVGWQIARAAARAANLTPGAARTAALEALERVGFRAPGQASAAYPHELSGGMRQLAVIAMAVVSRPALLLADEPTTALDVTTQARVIRELAKLRDRSGTAILLISHDLGVIAQCASRAMIMYCGRVVERADCATLFRHPAHPYTAGLLDAMPRLDTPSGHRVRPIPGQVPPPGQTTPGCAFEPRCHRASGACRETAPTLGRQGGTEVACHHPR